MFQRAAGETRARTFAKLEFEYQRSTSSNRIFFPVQNPVELSPTDGEFGVSKTIQPLVYEIVRRFSSIEEREREREREIGPFPLLISFRINRSTRYVRASFLTTCAGN